MARESTVLMERGEKTKSRTVEGGKMSDLKPLNTVRKQNLRKQWRHLEKTNYNKRECKWVKSSVNEQDIQ